MIDGQAIIHKYKQGSKHEFGNIPIERVKK